MCSISTFLAQLHLYFLRIQIMYPQQSLYFCDVGRKGTDRHLLRYVNVSRLISFHKTHLPVFKYEPHFKVEGYVIS